MTFDSDGETLLAIRELRNNTITVSQRCASILFQSNVPEKIVKECTGCRSLRSTTIYERIYCCRSFGHSFYLLSLNLGKEPIPYTNDQGSTVAVHPFQPHGMPLFASAQICTIDS